MKKSFSDLKPHFDTLKRLRRVMPDAIMAGGALRDIYHNIPINDVDIYVSYENSDAYNEDFWCSFFNIDDTTKKYIQCYSNEEDSEYLSENQIETVWKIHDSKTLYNIIIVELDSPIEYVESFFDIGLCKAYSDGTKVRLTSDFIHDSKNKKLTIVSEDMNQHEFCRMMDNHVKRTSRKYPGYSLVIPERFQEFYKQYKNR